MRQEKWRPTAALVLMTSPGGGDGSQLYQREIFVMDLQGPKCKSELSRMVPVST